MPIWKVDTNVEKNEAPAVAEAYLLPHMVDELTIVKHTSMTDAIEKLYTEYNCQIWLVKFAPFRTSWTDIVRRGTFTLRGVRNPQARNNLAAMKVNDLVLYYHSQQELAIVGIMKVTREAYSDPTSSDPQWLTCDFSPVLGLPQPVMLEEIKRIPELQSLPLVKQPRLAIMPVTKEAYMVIGKLASDNLTNGEGQS
jgi:predicted RNA-binding protein with PUA-like domain